MAGSRHHRRGGTWRSLVSVSVWGTEGPGFKSRRPDIVTVQRLGQNVGIGSYGADMPRKSNWEISWTDVELKDAVAAAANWRDVMRALGLHANSAGAIRIVKRHVVSLGLDTSHFRGKRSWSDAQLRRAVIDAQSWDELLLTLGLAPHSGDGRVRVKAHAMRLRLDLRHLESSTANPELIDWFFIVDGDLTIYLIPALVIAGRVNILLHTYTKYIVGSAAGLMAPSSRAA
jgi:hypothetical protein